MMISSYVAQDVCSSLDFWHLPISKNFNQPNYFLGQQVFHRIKQSRGEILHPVTVVGISWTGMDWEYGVEFPEDHPYYERRENEREWVSECELELM